MKKMQRQVVGLRVQKVKKMNSQRRVVPSEGDWMKMMTTQNPRLTLRPEKPLQMLEKMMRTSKKKGESLEPDLTPASPLLVRGQNTTSPIGRTVRGAGTAPEGAVRRDLTRAGRRKIEISARKEFQP